MRTLCSILLLGVVTYVQADHDCSPLAVKIGEFSTQDYSSETAPPLPLQEFINKITGVFFVDEIFPKETPDAQKYCIPACYSEKACGGIEYATKYLEGQSAIDENLLTGKIFETISISLTMKNFIKYRMIFAGADTQNYIFKKFDEIPIDVQLFPGHDISKQVQMQLTGEIHDTLATEFALFSYQPGPEGYNLFVSCDGKAAWATYKKGTNPTPEMNHALQGDIIKLVRRIREIFRENIYLQKTNKYFVSHVSDYLMALYNTN